MQTIESLPPGWEDFGECRVDQDTHTTYWGKPHMLCSKNLEQSSSNKSSKHDATNSIHTEIDCSKVAVRKTLNKGFGAFTLCDIKQNDLIEKGVVRRINYDGNCSPYLFSWSEDRTIWAFGSGCATFYNTSRNPNTKMIRFYDEDRYEIYALRDITKNEELTHRYISLEWRACFEDLRNTKKL